MNAANRTTLRLARSHKTAMLAAYTAIKHCTTMQEEYQEIQNLLKDKCVKTEDPETLAELVSSMGRGNAILHELVALKKRLDSL